MSGGTAVLDDVLIRDTLEQLFGLTAERERDGARHEVRDGELRLGLTRMSLEEREQRARVDKAQARRHPRREPHLRHPSRRHRLLLGGNDDPEDGQLEVRKTGATGADPFAEVVRVCFPP
jgi:hypothetical protein